MIAAIFSSVLFALSTSPQMPQDEAEESATRSRGPEPLASCCDERGCVTLTVRQCVDRSTSRDKLQTGKRISGRRLVHPDDLPGFFGPRIA